MKADLHNHSYFSDGVLSPSEVIKLASDASCDLFSLTDHDTTNGIVEAQLEADKIGLKFVNGVEISAFWRNNAIHIVGLGIDIDNDMLQTGLEFNQKLRNERAKKIALDLWRSGIKDALEKAQKISGGHMLTRTHFAQMLIEEGYCKDMKSVFRRYLTLIAHPFRYRMTQTKIKKMLNDFKASGGDGFEVVNANSSEEEISLGNQWSESFDLLTSIGSDFHGWPNQRVQIGNLADLPNSKRAIWSFL